MKRDLQYKVEKALHERRSR